MKTPKELNTLSNQLRVARAFCRELREYLSPQLVGKIIARNKREGNEHVCHSHDFCDGNQIMLNAFTRCRLPSPAATGYINDDDYMNLWSKAWTIASRSGFVAANCNSWHA